MQPTNLKDFPSVDEAVKLIQSDSRENPVVDMDWLISHTRRIEAGRNFRIPRIRALKPEEQWTDKMGNKHLIENIGSITVPVNSNYEKELLKKTIHDKYYEFTHKEYKELKTRGISTVVDDSEGATAATPRARTPMAKEGEALGSGTITTNAEGLSV